MSSPKEYDQETLAYPFEEHAEDVVTPPSKGKRMAGSALVAIVAIFCAIGVALSMSHCSGSTTGTAGDTEAAAETEAVEVEASEEMSVVTVSAPDAEAEATEPAEAEEASEAKEPVVVSSSCVTVTMPAKYEEMGCRWIVSHEIMSLEYHDAASGQNVVVTSILWGEEAKHPGDIKHHSYELGQVTDGGVVSDALLYVSDVDGDGKTIYGGLDTEGTPACEYYLGISADEILSWIETNGVVESAADENVSTRADGLSARTKPFWGTWAYASKDLGEAVAFAQGARGDGYDAEVFLTTDWSNLNTEAWYVVSLGCFGDESAAASLAGAAQAAGYEGAYAKFSGDYWG